MRKNFVSYESRLWRWASRFVPATKHDAHLIIMSIEELQTQVKANTDAEASAAAVLKELHDRLVAAGTDPAKLQQVRDDLESSRAALAAAIVANTPAAS